LQVAVDCRRAKERPYASSTDVRGGALVTAPMTASAQQSLNLSIGGFSPRRRGRARRQRRPAEHRSFLAFNVADLNGFTIGGEYLIGLGDKFDAGFGIGFYQRSTPAFDRFNEFRTPRSDRRDLKLRVVPMSATFRFLPARHHGVQPYIGAGAGVFAYRYSESRRFRRER